MSDSSAEQGMTTLDLKPLERLDAKRKIGVAIDILANSIAPHHFDFRQRANIENGLNLLVDLILIEAETRSVERLGGGQ